MVCKYLMYVLEKGMYCRKKWDMTTQTICDECKEADG